MELAEKYWIPVFNILEKPVGLRWPTQVHQTAKGQQESEIHPHLSFRLLLKTSAGSSGQCRHQIR